MTRVTFFLFALLIAAPTHADFTTNNNDARQIVLNMKRKIKASKGATCLSPEMLESELDKLIQLLPKSVAGGESSGGHTIPRHHPRNQKDQLAGGESSGGHTLPPGNTF